jgi:hypothetical protein
VKIDTNDLKERIDEVVRDKINEILLEQKGLHYPKDLDFNNLYSECLLDTNMVTCQYVSDDDCNNCVFNINNFKELR